MSKSVIVLGAGGHAKVLIDMLHLMRRDIIGITCLNLSSGQHLLNEKVLGTDDELQHYDPKTIELVNGIGSLPGDTLRHDIFAKYKKQGYTFATVVHPTAIIASSVSLAEGAQVMAGAIIQPDVFVGENTIINTAATIDHDCQIGANVHVAPGCTLSGNVKIRDRVHLGTASIVIQTVVIEGRATIAAGSVVYENVRENKLFIQKKLLSS